jgi:hypothetical protein
VGVFAVGNGWLKSAKPTAETGQTIQYDSTNSVGETAIAGAVTITDTAPTKDPYNLDLVRGPRPQRAADKRILTTAGGPRGPRAPGKRRAPNPTRHRFRGNAEHPIRRATAFAPPRWD